MHVQKFFWWAKNTSVMSKIDTRKTQLIAELKRGGSQNSTNHKPHMHRNLTTKCKVTRKMSHKPILKQNKYMYIVQRLFWTTITM